ncbi:MAG: leucine-rich repeat protein [Oscillospiraceae bacterium]|nr:leucine-rich repeat protein [Oscillospiraceae bacterium]
MKNKMISWISAMLVCVNACGTMFLYVSAEQTGESVTETAAEQSNTCGDRLKWSFDSDTGALTIAGTGDMDFHGDFYAPWHSVCKKIQSLSLPEGLTSIEVNAFAECDKLTSVSIPDSVKEIGDCAFYD